MISKYKDYIPTEEFINIKPRNTIEKGEKIFIENNGNIDGEYIVSSVKKLDEYTDRVYIKRSMEELRKLAGK